MSRMPSPPVKFLALALSLLLPLISGPACATDTSVNRYEVKKLLRFKIASLQQLASETQLVEEVRQRNRQSLSMNDILEIDERWSEYPPDHSIIQSMYSSPTGQRLKQLVELDNAIYSEIFLTDAQGANITSWPITSDFWQGDEAKWQRSFNKGEGSVYVGVLDFDRSSDAYSVKVSVPVLDHGRAIGVLIAGIRLSYLQASYLDKLMSRP